MAALGKIRQRSGLLIAVIGIALAAFVLGDFLKSGNSQQGNVPVGIVNGEDITYKDYNRQAEQNVENQRQNSQTNNLSSAQMFQVKKGTWDQMVKKIIMDEEIEELGLAVSKEELFDLVQGKNPHRIIQQYFRDPKTNQFNGDLVREYIQNLDKLDAKQMQQWISLENYLKEDRLNTKYNNLILKGYYIPESIAKLEYFEKGNKADVDFFGVKYGTVADKDVTVDDNDYQNYYEKTKENYRIDKEMRKVEYVVFDIKPSKEDISETQAQVSELYNELKTTPFEDVPTFINAVSDKQYVDLADSLYKVLKRHPRKFDAIAKKYSDGPSKTKGGDLGWFADGNMVPAFNQAVLDNRKGAVTVAETSFGFHVIKVTGKKAPVKKVKVAQFERLISPSNKTYQNVYMKASAFAGENTTYADFEKAVAEQGLNKRSAGYITTDKSNIAGLHNPRQLVRWAFKEETAKGDVSEIIDDDNSYIVAVVADVQTEGYKALETVKNDIKPLVLREKKAEKIIKQIEDKGTKNFEQLALGLGAEIKHSDKLGFKSFNLPGYGREVEVIGKIFNLEENKISAPLQGSMAVYVIRVNKFINVPELKDYSGTRKSMEADFMRRGYSIYKALEENSEIEDNTIIYF